MSQSRSLALLVACAAIVVACSGSSTSNGTGSGGSGGAGASDAGNPDATAGGSGGSGGIDCGNVGCAAPPLCATGCTAACGCCACTDGDTLGIDGGTYVCTGGCYAPAIDGGGGVGGSAGTAGADSGAGAGGTAGVDGGAGAGGTAGAAGTDGGAGAGNIPPLLVSDSATSKIYALDTSGSVLQQYTSPVSGVRGVAHDRAAGDGFWVVGTGNTGALFKVSWAGALTKTLTLDISATSPRGLDYMVDSTGGDRLVVIGTNSVPVDDLRAYDLTGKEQLESGFYTQGVFQQGVWGVDAVAPNGIYLERWTSWNNGTLQHWMDASNLSATVNTTLSSLRGVDRTAGGEFWVVASNTVYHLATNGSVLSSFSAPGTNAQGLSYSQ